VLVARDEESQQRPTSGPTELPGIVTLAGGSSPMFPDLGGLGARDALRILARLGLTARVTGAGVVVDQVPEAGSAIERGAVATLRLDRQPRLDPQFPADAATEAATRRTP